ncbi:hypothetical protein RHMOL_Rhmol07G0250800 [Rhododendron molle]|uniref:Uncharacterized protein n=1 Tax=Rhododendron molle TaxID=49168 RepID=A0ACC0N597_RHOML|nr:hypothetical protein RHMOL_Rhmol07G0250800 [Rhododendron molle]
MSAAVSGAGVVSDGVSARSLSEISEEAAAVRVGVDLVAAARRNLRFLRVVAESHWLQQKPTIVEAIRRYDELWMPLISDLTVGSPPPMVLPPIDIELVWFCHSLNPFSRHPNRLPCQFQASYARYCESRFSKLIGKPAIFNEGNEEYALIRCRDIWIHKYPSEPFENELASDGSIPLVANEDLLSLVLKQRNLYAKLSAPYMSETVYLIAARQRYKRFLCMMQRFSNLCAHLVPASDILLMWVSHQGEEVVKHIDQGAAFEAYQISWFDSSPMPGVPKSYPTVYAADAKEMEGDMGKVVAVWEEEVEETKKLWEGTFDEPYEKAGGAACGWAAKVKPPIHWEVTDDDVNTRYKSMLPRFLLEVGELMLNQVCVFVKLDSKMMGMQGKTPRELLCLRMVRCHKELKIDKQISSFPLGSWQKAWHLYCEFGTRGVVLEFRDRGSHCFEGSTVKDTVTFLWNDLLRATSLTRERVIDRKIRVVSSMTPPIQAPYLLKCVPDRVTDDSGAMICDLILRMNQYHPQEGRWLSRTVLDHAGRECFIVRMRGFWRRGAETPSALKWEERIIEIREGSWSYVADSIGRAPGGSERIGCLVVVVLSTAACKIFLSFVFVEAFERFDHVIESEDSAGLFSFKDSVGENLHLSLETLKGASFRLWLPKACVDPFSMGLMLYLTSALPPMGFCRLGRFCRLGLLRVSSSIEDVLDKSGPKIARHQSIYDSLTLTQRSPYIPPDNVDDLVYHGVRKCSEIDERGFSKDRGSSHISLLRPFFRSEVDDSIPGSNFNLLIKKIKKMKNEGVGWDSSFNIRGTSSHLQEPMWLFWLSDVLSSFAPILEKAGIYSAVYISQFSYTRNINVFKAFLERWSPDTNTFHATYGEVGFSLWDLHRVSGLPILGGLYEEYTPTNDILYSDRARPTCCALFDIYANQEKSKNLSLWSSYFVEPHADSFQRRQNISDEVYLAGFLASWISDFVLPHSSNEVRSSTFVMASKMARGLLLSLAIPVLAYLYHCFNRVANSSIPGKKAIYGPFQYLFGWMSIYFPKTYSRGNPSNGELIDKLIPYLGFIGMALTHDDEPKGRIHDDKNISPFLFSYLVCLRSGILTFKVGSSLLSEPYAPSRYARQFGFSQACPGSLDTSCRRQSDPATFFYYWYAMLRKGTDVIIELPSTRHLAFVTEPYARWWIASSFVVLQFSTELKRKQSNQPKPKTPRKRTKNTTAPIILDTPTSSRPDVSTSRRSFGRSSMLLGPDKAARPSPRRYPQGYLLNILQSKCRNFCGKPVHFEFENPEAVICPLEMMFPETLDHSTQEFVSSLDQFRAYIDSLLEGKDSIIEGKDVQAILNKFEKGHELLVLGIFTLFQDFPPQSLPHLLLLWLPSKIMSLQRTRGEASFDDLMDLVELEELIVRIEKPPVQSNPLSSNLGAVHIQKGLFISLQSSTGASTINIEDIITQSNAIISILKSFNVDLSSLYEKVKALVKYSVLWTKVSDSSSDKDVSLGELEAQYEVKKANFEEMASSYEEMASSVSNLSERVTSLEEEITRTKELLKKLESDLSSCKAKHSSSQSDFTKYSITISKSEKDLQVALDRVEQCKKKSAHYDAVKEALDAVRASLKD